MGRPPACVTFIALLTGDMLSRFMVDIVYRFIDLCCCSVDEVPAFCPSIATALAFAAVDAAWIIDDVADQPG